MNRQGDILLYYNEDTMREGKDLKTKEPEADKLIGGNTRFLHQGKIHEAWAKNGMTLEQIRSGL